MFFFYSEHSVRQLANWMGQITSIGDRVVEAAQASTSQFEIAHKRHFQQPSLRSSPTPYIHLKAIKNVNKKYTKKKKV